MMNEYDFQIHLLEAFSQSFASLAIGGTAEFKTYDSLQADRLVV